MNEQLLQIEIPKEYDLKLPDPYLVDYYTDKKNRLITIDFEIENSLMREVGELIMEYNRQDKNIPVEERKKIVMLINSFGGDLESTYATIGIMELSKTPIITVNMNCAYSAAGLLLLAGNERYCMPRSQMLIHSGSANGISGNYEDVQENAKSYKKMVEDMREFILSKTKIDKSLLNKNKSKDWYIDYNQQVSLGCVDEILQDLDKII